MIGPHLCLMRPVTVVELGMALGQTIRKAGVALTRTRIPPTAHFARVSRVAQVQDHIKLVVVRIGGIKISGAGGEVRELAVDEPNAMDAARVGSGGVEEGEFEIFEALGVLEQGEIGYIQDPEAGGFLTFL